MKIGVILEDLGMSQLSYSVISNINKACEHNSENDYIIFFNNMVAPVIPPNCALMNSSEIWSFDGHLIGTSVATTLMALKSINPAKKYFYVWDLEWTRHAQHRQYSQDIPAFRSRGVSLIARSKEHAAAIQNYSNRKVSHIVSDFDIENIHEVINNES